MPDDGTLADEQLSGREIVTTALALLRANYVFPELAEQAAVAVEARLAAGEYDDLDEITLTELAHQPPKRGLRGQAPAGAAPPRSWPRPGPPGPGPGPGPTRPEPARSEVNPPITRRRRLAMRQQGRLDNFGIHRVERLDGNVGYLDMRRVPVPANAGRPSPRRWNWSPGPTRSSSTCGTTAAGRRRAWSSGAATCSRNTPTHLNDIFHADTGETRQFWALPYVPGTRYVDRPVYVLTSSHTFSGGEDFAYTLQALGRAEVIGETTGGGAHPTRGFPISQAVHIAIPFARSINPVTGTNWQGTGVVPDIAVPEAEACDVAYARALRHVLHRRRAPAHRGRADRAVRPRGRSPRPIARWPNHPGRVRRVSLPMPDDLAIEVLASSEE